MTPPLFLALWRWKEGCTLSSSLYGDGRGENPLDSPSRGFGVCDGDGRRGEPDSPSRGFGAPPNDGYKIGGGVYVLRGPPSSTRRRPPRSTPPNAYRRCAHGAILRRRQSTVYVSPSRLGRREHGEECEERREARRECERPLPQNETKMTEPRACSFDGQGLSVCVFSTALVLRLCVCP